jgi:ribosomal protein S18 acetylase RimI-like enzyme
MHSSNIRPFQQADAEAVLRIGADTAFFGEPVEAYLDDRRLFCDAFYHYYTKYEAEYGWVADVEDQVVGFLMGCVDTRAQHRRWLRLIFPKLTISSLTGRYHLRARTWRYAFSLLRGALEDEYPSVDLEVYPAHLHINMEASWRGRGLGRKLIEAYLVQLHRLNIPGVHLMTTSENNTACILYEHIGFKLLSARKTRSWAKLIPHPIENRCYGLRL